MFRNALVYSIDPWTPPPLGELSERLAAAAFVPCGATQPESAGWVAPRGLAHAALAESVGGQLVLALCVERKAVPRSAVKEQLEQRLDQVEQDTGRRPRGKRAKEFEEEIVRSLLPRAFPKRAAATVWIDPQAQRLVIGTASSRQADAVVTLLVQALGGGIVVRALQTQLAPATAMAQWLQEREPPPGFSIDRECVLQQPDSERSVVRYARHTLEIEEIGEHIRSGKVPTQLAMTWAGRVSFVLTEGLALRRITLLDGVLDGAPKDSGDERFDADVAILTGELRGLIPDLVDALGGPLSRPAPDAPAAAAPAPHTAAADAEAAA